MHSVECTEIQHCLVNAGDVGCGVFECFENNSCEIRGLQQICMTFLHNAGKFDSQGKSFIKDALKCMAHGLRHKFSCISRKCQTIKEMVFQLQHECYIKHNLCAAAKDNVNVIVQMIHFQDLFPKGLYVELVNILLSCGEEVREAITRSVRLQCEQNWGALCNSLSFCSPGPPEAHLHPTRVPDSEHHNRGVSWHPVPPSPSPEEKDKAKNGGPTLPVDIGQGAWLLSPGAALADPKKADFR
ncbi:stanniocalcin-2-like, partial [Scleropages formosus]